MKIVPPEPSVNLYEDGLEAQDILQRKRLGADLSDLRNRIDDPLVVALDSKWGTGKTYFLNRSHRHPDRAASGTDRTRESVKRYEINEKSATAGPEQLPFGFDFAALIRLHEHVLIISDYDSWRSVVVNNLLSAPRNVAIPVHFQAQQRLMEMASDQSSKLRFRIEGPALSLAGRELSKVVKYEPMPECAK